MGINCCQQHHLRSHTLTRPSISGPSQPKAPSLSPTNGGAFKWNPDTSRLSFNFGTVGPSEGPQPWVLERKHAWDFNYWLSPSGEAVLDFLQRAQTLRLELSEEFLFDTIDRNDMISSWNYIDVVRAPRLLTPWREILATLRRAFQSLKKRIDLLEIHVRGLGSLSSMSDCGAGPEQRSPAVLRPTELVYAEFMDEFTKFGPGTIQEVRLSGLFPADWAGLIEARMPGTRVRKDLSRFVKEIRWWTALGEDWEGKPESEVRRMHDRARRTMLNGAGGDYSVSGSEPKWASSKMCGSTF